MWQIAAQLLFITAGLLYFDFSLLPAQLPLTMIAALIAQALWLRALRISHVGHLSAIITAMGLILLLRADSLWAHPVAAVCAISSKFILRVGGKHVWNPANFGLVIALLFLPGTWLSPGQWGQGLSLAILFLMLGSTVVMRAGTYRASWLFLLCYLTLVVLRFIWLGYPAERVIELTLNKATNGALLLYTFFMISDPMTLPNHHRLRLLHLGLVALLAFIWVFLHYQPNGLIWALFILAPLTPLWDRLWPAEKYAWTSSQHKNTVRQGSSE